SEQSGSGRSSHCSVPSHSPKSQNTESRTTRACAEGDDRNRTGVDGFAVCPFERFSAFLCDFRRPQLPPTDGDTRSFGEPSGSLPTTAATLLDPCQGIAVC